MKNIYESLKKDHDKVKEILDEIEGLSTEEETPEQESLFNKLKKEIILHSKAEEKVFYATLKEQQEIKEKINHAEKEHKEVEALLEELTDNSLAGTAWFQKFKTLKNSLTHHIQEEEGEIFSFAQKIIKTNEEQEMDILFQELKNKIDEEKDIEQRRSA